MKDLSEKTQEILKAAGIANLYNYSGLSVYGITLSLEMTRGSYKYSMTEINRAADEIEKALKGQ